MTNLAKVLEGEEIFRAFFILLSLNLKDANGSPVRALATIEKVR
ncbi:MAG: hypothetical protein QXU98_08900 [Candidatus Parvarchaeota archaeon]